MLQDETMYAEIKSNKFSFISKGLLYLEDTITIRNLVISLLKNKDKNISIAVDYSTYFFRNMTYVNNSSNVDCIEISDLLDTIITSLGDTNYIYLLHNFNKLLSDIQKSNIVERLKSQDFSKENGYNFFIVSMFFSEKEIAITEEIKKAIIGSSRLWATGISLSADGGYNISSINYLPLKRFRYSSINKYGLSFTKQESIDIYNRLLSAFDEIKKLIDRESHSPFNDWVFILEEMYLFLKEEKEKLSSQESYNLVYAEIFNYFKDSRGYEDIVQGLISPSADVVLRSTVELFNSIYLNENTNENNKEFSLLLNKLVVQRQPRLEESLQFTADYLVSFKDTKGFIRDTFILELILNNFIDNPLQKSEKSFIEEQLVKIAMVLESWGNDSDSVKYWIKQKEKSHYNNVRTFRF